MDPGDQKNAEKPANPLVRQILIAFSGAFKKRNLYSGSHTVYINALNALQNSLEQHFSRFGNLIIRIARNQILCDNEVVYQGSDEPTDLAFILHRDGILNFEFQEGLELWELDTLLKILHDHCTLADNAEDDIVTALWQFNLPSIHYEAADLELSLPEESRLFYQQDRQGDLAEGEQEDADAKTETDSAHDDPRSVSPLEHRSELFHLTLAEREQLGQMVLMEEQLDNTDYVVDVLLYILEQHSLPEDVEDLLGTLSQELGHALSKGRFAYLHAVIIKLKHYHENLKSASHWSTPYMERFLGALSDRSFLDHLPALSSLLEEKPDSLKDLKKLLLLLDCKCITILGPMMLRTPSAALQRVLIATIAAMADRDFAPLEKLIYEAEADLMPRLVFILGYLKDEASRRVLSDLIGHPAAAVRRQVLRAILARDNQALEEIFTLIDDPDESIRKMVLQHFGRERNVRMERLLLRYLEAQQAADIDDDHYMAICRLLGRCGSDQSLHYLTHQLFKWPLLGIPRSAGNRLRRGAIIALEGVNSTKATHLVQRSRKGFWGNFLRPA